MMEPPFFNSHYQTQPPPQHRSVPVSNRAVPARTPPPQPRRSVQIPIYYVESTQRHYGSALKIQKVFRGFRVRKTVKKILELKREVDVVEKKLWVEETVALIKGDGMERLKVNESLMSLLFKLDSVKGFNDEIRVCRKAVIKKAIMLQEFVDSVVEERNYDETNENCVENSANMENSEEVNDETLENNLGRNNEEINESCVENSENMENSEEINDETLENSIDEGLNDFSRMQVDDSAKSTEEAAMQVETCVAGSEDAWECVGEETEEPKSDVVEEDRCECSEDKSNSAEVKGNEDWYVVGDGKDGEKKEVNLLEKMAEDNKRLMAMVADLHHNNKIQTQMICSLSQRVEHLEKAMNDRLRKKKKKLNASLLV